MRRMTRGLVPLHTPGGALVGYVLRGWIAALVVAGLMGPGGALGAVFAERHRRT